MAVGVVNVEINIEKHLIADLLFLRKRALYTLSLSAGHTQARYLWEVKALTGAFIKKLYLLHNLEVSEQGTGKFTEINILGNIVIRLKDIFKYGVSQNTIYEIDDIISELKKLKNMELRLG